PGVLLAVERRHDRASGTDFTSEVERQLRTVEPQPEVVLARGRDGRRWVRRHRESLLVEDASHGGGAVALSPGVHIGLIPRDAERLGRLLDDEQVESRTVRHAMD